MFSKLVDVGGQLIGGMLNAIGVAQLLVALAMVGMVLASFYLKPIKTWRQFFNWVLVFGVLIMLCVMAFYFF